jgi:hypothetical protein
MRICSTHRRSLMRVHRMLAAALALLAAPATRADTVEVSATTLLNVAQQTRGADPELVTVAPAFEILSLTARELRNPFADDLTIVLSTWGSYEFQDPRWDNGTQSDLTGDVMTGYVQGRLLDRHLTLRLGRAQVQTGVARMIHLDGGEAIALLPAGVRLSAYAGVPVSQRFTTRTGLRNWNPLGGDLAYGGRLGWSLPLPGIAGRGLDIGASVNVVSDDGDAVKQEVGADLRFRPVAPVVVSGFGAYSLFDERLSEATGRIAWTATRALLLEADYRFMAPDLFLARNSILSVFSAEERQQFGGGAEYRIGRGLRVGANYHLQLEPGETGSANDEIGHEADARIEWERGHTLVGLDGFFLDAFENGYVGGRIFGRQEYGKLFAAADVILHVFREEVNLQDYSVSGTLSAGVELARGLSAVVAGRAGVTPFLERTADVLVKLVYEQTYRKTEVR